MVPENGQLAYSEGVFIGYRAWEKAGRTPVYAFGHGLGYTDWAYESVAVEGATVRVRLRNTGERAGHEIVQIYVAPAGPEAAGGPERPARWLAGFAGISAAAGETALAPAIAGRLLARMRSPRPTLSHREIQVLRLVAEGATNSDIGRHLHISDATVKSHLVHIYTKLGVSSRTAAVAAGRESGILP